MKKKSFGQTAGRLREARAVRYSIVVVFFFLSFALLPLPAAQAADLNICVNLSTGTPGAPVVALDVFAGYKGSTVFGLNGTALSTQATHPLTELSYVLSGTAYVTAASAVELSLTGTAEDANCNCIKEVVFNIVFDGVNDRYTQIIRNAKDGTTSILTGTAEVAQSCGQ